MSTWKELVRRARYLGRRSQFDRELDDEIQFHIETRAEELQQEGVPAEAAREQARREFGSVVAAKESFYRRDRWSWLNKLVRNLRFALRALRHNPVFAATAILTLALGIGANTAVFSVMNAVLLRSLPVADPQRLGPLLRPQGRVILAIDGLQPDVGHEVLRVLRDCLSGEILLARSLLSSTAPDLAGLIAEVHG